MRTRFVHAGILLGGMALAVASAHADSGSGPTKFGGIAVGPGNVARTISDVPGPNEPSIQSTQSTLINVPVSNGQSGITIGTNMRDAINTNPTLLAAQYSAKLIFAPTGEARLKVTRQVGSYTSGDVLTGGGYTVNPDQFQSVDAPALSPVGLVSLFGALPALVFWNRRRKRVA